MSLLPPLVIELPGSCKNIPPETWKIHEDDAPIAFRFLEMAGVDLYAHDIGCALAGVIDAAIRDHTEYFFGSEKTA